MGIYTTAGIVFRTMKYKETSLIVDVFTKEKGLRSYIISGARSAKAKSVASTLQLMNVVELTSYDGDPDKLMRLKEVSLSHPYTSIPFDVVRAALATFMLEATRNSIRDREPDPDLFDFVVSHFIELDQGASMRLFHLKYLIDLSQILGFYPMPNRSDRECYFDLKEGRFSSRVSSHTHNLDVHLSLCLHKVIECPWENLQALEIGKKDRDELLDQILKYYQYHLDDFKPLKSLSVLKVVLS